MQGNKSNIKNRKNNMRRRDTAKIVADIHGVSPDYVRKIMRGEREREDIILTFMTIIEQDNRLIESVKQLVPFN